MVKRNVTRKKIYFIVIGVIFNSLGRVLLTQRNDPDNSYAHLKWQPPGGEIEYGEHPLDTLHREILEETGLQITLLTQQPIIYTHTYEESHKHIVMFVYPATPKDITIDFTLDKETADAQWYPLDKIDEAKCLPLTKEIVEDARQFYALP